MCSLSTDLTAPPLGPAVPARGRSLPIRSPLGRSERLRRTSASYALLRTSTFGSLRRSAHVAHASQVVLDDAPVLLEKRPVAHASQVALEIAPVLLRRSQKSVKERLPAAKPAFPKAWSSATS